MFLDRPKLLVIVHNFTKICKKNIIFYQHSPFSSAVLKKTPLKLCNLIVFRSISFEEYFVYNTAKCLIYDQLIHLFYVTCYYYVDLNVN